MLCYPRHLLVDLHMAYTYNFGANIKFKLNLHLTIFFFKQKSICLQEQFDILLVITRWYL